MTEEVEISATQKLMETLINKMESMDSKLTNMEQQLNSPNRLLKKAGFVAMRTPIAEDVGPDGFRGELLNDAGVFAKSSQEDFSNQQIHEMSWEEIHDMAESVQPVTEMY